MNALLLAACVLITGTNSAFLKLYQKRNGAGPAVSLLFTGIMCVTIAVVCIIACGFGITWNTTSFVMSVIMGILYAINMPLCAKAMELGSLGLCSVFTQLGSLTIPFFYGVIFLPEEQSTWLHWLGLLTALAAVLLQIPSKKNRGDVSLKFLLIGVATLINNGVFCAMIKAQSVMENAVSKPQVLFFAGVSGAVVSFAVLGFGWLRNKQKHPMPVADTHGEVPAVETIEKKYDLSLKILALPVVYGVLNATVNLLNLFLGERIPATMHYPVLSCGGLLLATVLGVVVFRDHITKRSILTLCLCVATILCFAF